MKNNIINIEELLNYIYSNLKNKNLEPLLNNKVINYETLVDDMWFNFQKNLLIPKNKGDANDFLINTEQALIIHLRTFEALYTGKILYDYKDTNRQKASIFNFLLKENGAKEDIDLNLWYLEKNFKSSVEYPTIKNNLLQLKKNVSVFKGFLNEPNQTPENIPNISYNISFDEKSIFINNIDLFLQKQNNEQKISDIENIVMQNFLDSWYDFLD